MTPDIQIHATLYHLLTTTASDATNHVLGGTPGGMPETISHVIAAVRPLSSSTDGVAGRLQYNVWKRGGNIWKRGDNVWKRGDNVWKRGD